MYDVNICRLCKSTDLLTNLNELDGSKHFYEKISNCLDLEVHSEDGLPTMICKKCKVKIEKFHKFKHKCLNVYTELKREIEKLPESIGNQFIYYEDISSPDDLGNESCNEEIGFEDNNCMRSCLEFEDKTEEVIQCDICGTLFRTKLEYRKHLASHGESKFYQCKYCPKRFTRSETNSVHMRSHFGIKPFICDICGKLSTKRQDLLRHMKIHTDERNYECLICGRRFKRSGDLSSHIRTHSGARPFKCNMCEKDYTSRNGLKKHMKIHGYHTYRIIEPLNSEDQNH